MGFPRWFLVAVSVAIIIIIALGISMLGSVFLWRGEKTLTMTSPTESPSTTIQKSVATTSTTTTIATSSPSPTISTTASTTQTSSSTSPTQTMQTKPGAGVTFLSIPSEVPVYGLAEIRFSISGLSYSNPYDTSEVDVWVYVYTPSGSVLAVPAFYYEDVGRGEGFWVARVSPIEEGVHRVVVKAADGKGNTVESSAVEFVARGFAGRGFARIDRGKGFIVFDNRESMIMLGINLAWPPNRATAVSFYERWFEKLNESSIKVVRIGLVPWALTLEWSKLHQYSQVDAAAIDEIVRLAEKYDIYIIFVFMWHNELADNWSSNPYNVARGGVIKSPEEFWSNPVAIRIFKDKVRYIIARWGYSIHILAWELANEVDLTTNFFNAREQFLNWVKEVSSFIKSIDPYKRIVTINLADYSSEPRVWEIETIDVINVHRYGPEGFKDVATAIAAIVNTLRSIYGKPVIVTEFGVDWRWIGGPGLSKGEVPLWSRDTRGVGLHEGLWSSVFSLSPVSAMSWWWDTQIDLYNLWYHFRALHEFLKGIDPARSGLERLSVSVETFGSRPGNITLYPLAGWVQGTGIRENKFVIYPNGTVIGILDLLSGFIYGTCHSQKALNPVFTVTMLDRGRMIIHVNSVGRAGAKLAIFVDNALEKVVDLPDKDGESNAVRNEYNMDVEVVLEPGTHIIKVSNLGCDWFSWDYITFENAVYRSAKVDVLAVGNNTFAMLWIRNNDYNWWNTIIARRSIEPAENVSVEVRGLEDGIYKVEFWCTYTGQIIKVEEIRVLNGVARIYVGTVEKDIALKIVKIG